MKIRLLLLWLLLLVHSYANAQAPANDDCQTAMPINTPETWCRYDLTNATATASAYTAPVCSDKDQGDVWFTFKAEYAQTKVTVVGKGMKKPMIALYNSPTDKCGNLLFENACSLDFDGDNTTELIATGLKNGERIFIRIYGEDGSKGTFDVCVKSYGTIPSLSSAYSDCNKAFELCDKTTMAFTNNGSPGLEIAEGDNISCFKSQFINVQTKKKRMAQWLKFRCEKAGKLSFTITPNNILKDDIDFVVYQMLNGKKDCSTSKMKMLRCMGGSVPQNTGGGANNSCSAATGLSENEFDIETGAECSFGSNNFLKALDMEEGVWYALFINTTLVQTPTAMSGGSGFVIDFGGSGTFSCNQGINPSTEIVASIANLRVYPSPSSQAQVHIEGVLVQQSEGNVPFRIVNQLGQVVFQSELIPNGETIDTVVELPQNLQNGLYLLDFEVNTQHVFRKWVLGK